MWAWVGLGGAGRAVMAWWCGALSPAGDGGLMACFVEVFFWDCLRKGFGVRPCV